MQYNIRLFLAASLALGAITAAVAEDDDDGRRYAASHPAWKAECGGCHVVYPPQILPARSWHALIPVSTTTSASTPASIHRRQRIPT